MQSLKFFIALRWLTAESYWAKIIMRSVVNNILNFLFKFCFGYFILMIIEFTR